MIATIKIKRRLIDGNQRWSWKALDSSGRKVGQGHREFSRLGTALKNVELLTDCSTEILPKMLGRYRVACWGRSFVIVVEES